MLIKKATAKTDPSIQFTTAVQAFGTKLRAIIDSLVNVLRWVPFLPTTRWSHSRRSTQVYIAHIELRFYFLSTSLCLLFMLHKAQFILSPCMQKWVHTCRGKFLPSFELNDFTHCFLRWSCLSSSSMCVKRPWSPDYSHTLSFYKITYQNRRFQVC